MVFSTFLHYKKLCKQATYTADQIPC